MLLGRAGDRLRAHLLALLALCREAGAPTAYLFQLLAAGCRGPAPHADAHPQPRRGEPDAVKRLDRYLAQLFVTRWLSLLVATLVLMGVLDSLGNSDVLPPGATLGDGLQLMALRMPVLFDRMALFTLLLAVLLTFATLVRHSELVILAGAGLSPLRQVRAMAPAILVAGLVSVLVIDLAVPPSARRIAEWVGPDAFSDPGQRVGDTLWIAEPEAFIEIGSVASERLERLTFFERAPDAGVVALTTARAAVFEQNGWRLEGVEQTRFDAAPPAPRVRWETDQTPQTLTKLGGDPRNLSLVDLGRMQRFGRGGGGEIGVAVGMGIGFCFFILDGVLKTLAASGGVAVWLAVGAPILALALLAAWLLYRCERLA
ncbi:MAG: hypothetical protein CVT80_04930 [Alphaproteobacteria bacterium HGW-Alphaproteobacteria-2]|nr:MAG: hypothetical protein CVT80_04930 [Alphaproteobacteria bacterium HGW-Alphaproteobacteria-2]